MKEIQGKSILVWVSKDLSYRESTVSPLQKCLKKIGYQTCSQTVKVRSHLCQYQLIFLFYVGCFLNCINFVTYCVSKLQFQRIFFSEEEKSPLSALVFELAQLNQTMWGQHLFTMVTFETVLSYIALVHIILNRERNLQLLCGSQTRYLRK